MTVGLILLFGGYIVGADWTSFDGGFAPNEVQEPLEEPRKTFTDTESEFEAGLAPFVVLNPTTGEASTSETNEVVMIVRKFKFIPDTIHVKKGDIVRIKIASGDYETAHSFAIDEYGIYEQIPAGKDRAEMNIITFTADKAGKFTYYCNGYGHSETGTLFVTE